MKAHVFAVAALAFPLTIAGCSRDTSMHSSPVARAIGIEAAARQAPGQPAYEPAYVDGHAVTINAILVGGKAPAVAQADLFLVQYPNNFTSLGLAPPQCDPCDHDGNGVDALDFHDHVLDSEPGSTEFRAPWHVWAVMPAYNGDAAHDDAVSQAYASHLPAKSGQAVNALLTATLPGGGALATKVDLNFYFICSVVNPNAAE